MNNAIFMQQVHGDNVVVVDKNSPNIIPNCDGLITNDPDATLVVRTADCLPISIVDENKKVIALIHAGWRGLQKEITKKAVSILINKFKSDPKNLKIKIGPHICQRHYEVNDDVASKFSEITIFNNKKRLNLSHVAINQLVGMGVDIKNIEIDKRCTFEDLSLPSYRRNKTEERLITKLNI